MAFFQGVLKAQESAPQVRIESIFYGRDVDVLRMMFSFYAPLAKEVRDVTANTRKMWKGGIFSFKPKFYDIDPLMKPDVVCNFGKLPDKNSSVDVLVYDPPHLPFRDTHRMTNDYGLKFSVKGADNIASLHPPFLAQAKRVLKRNGLIFAKIKDYVTSGTYQWNLWLFTDLCRKHGLTPCDLIIKRDAGGSLIDPRWKVAHHARNVHCYWVIVRKGKCTP